MALALARVRVRAPERLSPQMRGGTGDDAGRCDGPHGSAVALASREACLSSTAQPSCDGGSADSRVLPAISRQRMSGNPGPTGNHVRRYPEAGGPS